MIDVGVVLEHVLEKAHDERRIARVEDQRSHVDQPTDVRVHGVDEGHGRRSIAVRRIDFRRRRKCADQTLQDTDPIAHVMVRIGKGVRRRDQKMTPDRDEITGEQRVHGWNEDDRGMHRFSDGKVRDDVHVVQRGEVQRSIEHLHVVIVGELIGRLASIEQRRGLKRIDSTPNVQPVVHLVDGARVTDVDRQTSDIQFIEQTDKAENVVRMRMGEEDERRQRAIGEVLLPRSSELHAVLPIAAAVDDEAFVVLSHDPTVGRVSVDAHLDDVDGSGGGESEKEKSRMNY